MVGWSKIKTSYDKFAVDICGQTVWLETPLQGLVVLQIVKKDAQKRSVRGSN